MTGAAGTPRSSSEAASASDRDAISILVVDDSAVIRGLTKRWLEEEHDLRVVGSANNGEMAIEQTRVLSPDVVILDIEMPKLDGLSALPGILKARPGVRVVMSSTLTARNAEISLKALALGASDYVAKPEAASELQAPGGFRRELVDKVRALASARRMRPRGDARPVARTGDVNALRSRPEGGFYGKAPIVTRKSPGIRTKVIGIASSTGGPQALQKVLRVLGGRRNPPILITQHMPKSFTTILAQHLNALPGVECAEAVDGMVVESGRTYLAPGDYHMVVEMSAGKPVIRLNQNPPENFCRPAADPMFRSLAEVYGNGVLGVVLTGMGHDGLAGGQKVVDGGGMLIAQDEATSVVWGMPGAVATGGLCSAVLPLDDIGNAIGRVVDGGRP
jgi:two-component system chemotaxis response regulator CheB